MEAATREQAAVREKLSLAVNRSATATPDRGPAILSLETHPRQGPQSAGSAPSRDDKEGFALARATGDAVAVMRSVGTDDSAGTDDSSSDSSSQAARPDPRAMDELAREVYTRLRRRLIVDRERAGFDSRWT